jgi:hypothetical protein
LEEFQVGYSWLPQIPEVRVIASPYIEPRSLIPCHLPVEEFLEEWLWNWENMTLQLSGKAEQHIWTLPSGERERARLELNDLEPQFYEKKVHSCERCTVQQVLNGKKPTINLTTPPITEAYVPQRAPPPHNLIEGLHKIAGATTVEESAKIMPDIRAYLQALGWVEKKGSTLKMTLRGNELMEAWKQVETVIEWYEWLRNASQDILYLQPQRKLKEVLALSNCTVDNKLAEQLGFSLKMIRSQLLLANAFGILVRLNGKSWRTEWKPLPQAATLILNTAINFRHQANSISRAVRVDRLFTTLLKSTPLSLPNFRAGVFELFKQGKVGGTVPDTIMRSEGLSGVKMKALIPGKDGIEHPIIDLGAGDFLIPGKSCQVIIPLEDTT